MSENTPEENKPHDHSHDHDHAHKHPKPGDDAAQRSLADALDVSFKVLTILMFVAVIIYFASGVQMIPEQQKAVRLQFGRIVGGAQPKVYDSGLLIGFPPPIEERIIVEIAPQTLAVRKSFWYEVGEGQAGMTASELAESGGAKPLNPEKDGSLLTGDANVVHARFDLSYVVDNVVDYVTNVGNDKLLAENLVRSAADRGIVHAVAQTEADEVIAGRPNSDLAMSRANAMLADLQTGIVITSFVPSSTSMPLKVFGAYQAVSNAEADKAQQIDEARRKFTSTLGNAAGSASQSLYELMRDYEAASSAENAEQVTALEAELDTALAELRMPEARGGAVIGGEASTIISEAQAYRTQAVEAIKSEAQTFSLLLDQYKKSPDILKNRLWQDAREAVFTGDVETIYAPTGNLYIETNRDTTVARQREEKRLKATQEEARNK